MQSILQGLVQEPTGLLNKSNDQVYFQGPRGKLVFAGELKGVFVLFQLQFEGLDKSGMPGDAGS
jgi:hypothetical protein